MSVEITPMSNGWAYTCLTCSHSDGAYFYRDDAHFFGTQHASRCAA